MGKNGCINFDPRQILDLSISFFFLEHGIGMRDTCLSILRNIKIAIAMERLPR